MFELRELQFFVAVAERLNVSKAAQAVHLSQPALSRQIQSLERKLGVKLFERIGKRLILTVEGEDLLKHAAGLLDRAQELTNRAYGLKQGHTGLLRVGASPQTIAWLLSPVISEFGARHPNVDINVSEGHNDDLVRFVEHGTVHLVAAYLGVNNALVGQKLFTGRLFAVLPPCHARAGASAIRMDDIAGDSFLLMRRGFLTRHLFDQACAAHGVRPRIFLESDSTHTLCALAHDGHGVAVVSSSAQDTEYIRQAIPIQSDRCQTEADVSAIWNPNLYRPASLPAFLELLQKHAASDRRVRGPVGQARG